MRESSMNTQLLVVVLYERHFPLCILEIPQPSAVNGQMKVFKLKIDLNVSSRTGRPRLKRWGKFLSAW